LKDPVEITLTPFAWAEISRHAADAFPEECCGVVLDHGGTDEVRRLKNMQNQLHALDPETYPRTAAIAYAMDPKELETTMDEAASAGARIKAFYHSHPSHEAYFSEEDKAFAMPFGEPVFPEAAQIVVSIYDRAVKRIAAYAWVETKKDFVEISLKKISA
jgi:proteasome lid subunit RPN8/RPN11